MVLALFCTLFKLLIASVSDEEFCNENLLPSTVSKIRPFTLAEIISVSTTLKEVSLGLMKLASSETRSSPNGSCRSYQAMLEFRDSTIYYQLKRITIPCKNVWSHLLNFCAPLLRQIYTRDLQSAFCPEGHWICQNVNLQLLPQDRRGPWPFQPICDFIREEPPLSTEEIHSIMILREIPFVVPFNTRVGVFQRLVAANKLRMQGPSIQLTVRRSHFYEDAFDQLSQINGELSSDHID